MFGFYRRRKRYLGIDVQQGRVSFCLLAKERDELTVEAMLIRKLPIANYFGHADFFSVLATMLATVVCECAWQGLPVVLGFPIELINVSESPVFSVDEQPDSELALACLPLLSASAARGVLQLSYDKNMLATYADVVADAGLDVRAIDVDAFSAIRVAHFLQPMTMSAGTVRVLVFVTQAQVFLFGYQLGGLVFFKVLPICQAQPVWQACQRVLHQLLDEYGLELDSLVWFCVNDRSIASGMPYAVIFPNPFPALKHKAQVAQLRQNESLMTSWLAAGYALRGLV